jgi:hypothetical protein
MGQAATPLSQKITASVGLAPANRSEALRFTGSKEVAVLGLILAFLQILDGVLTAVGVSHFGTSIEGNVLIRHLMEQVGYVEALILVKGFALCVIAALCTLAGKVRWLGLAMRGIAVIYVTAAVIPWSFVIAKHIL